MCIRDRYIGDVEILFGDDSDIHNKMENVYRIMLDKDINIAKGYINVSFNGAPVIKVDEVKEEPTIEEGISEENGIIEDASEQGEDVEPEE